mgnify:CR=1 FL=1
MYWIALQASRDELCKAWGWRALQFTPRVALTEDERADLMADLAREHAAGMRRWADCVDDAEDRLLFRRGDVVPMPMLPVTARFAAPVDMSDDTRSVLVDAREINVSRL